MTPQRELVGNGGPGTTAVGTEWPHFLQICNCSNVLIFLEAQDYFPTS